MTHEISMDEAQVRAKAFEIWQHRGCPVGSPERDWFAAIDLLSAALTASEPAAPAASSAAVAVRWLATPAPANAAPEAPPARRAAAGSVAAAAQPRSKSKRGRRAKR